jgi:CDP-diacylglycerol--glycerol-3-phosphate 3-phosphatidyltransferase
MKKTHRPPAAGRPVRFLRFSRVNLPNQLTLLRIALVPPFIVLFLSDSLWAQWGSLLVFLAAAVTDYFDGAIARKRGLVTNFGKVMDPLADKLLMMTALVCLVQIGTVPGWTVVLILWREFAVTGLRTLAAVRHQVMAADWWGKLKTVSQMVAVVTCMLLVVAQNTLNTLSATWMNQLQAWGWLGEKVWFLLDTNALPYWLMFVTAALSLYSGFNYFSTNWELICRELERHS